MRVRKLTQREQQDINDMIPEAWGQACTKVYNMMKPKKITEGDVVITSPKEIVEWLQTRMFHEIMQDMKEEYWRSKS